MVVVKLWRPGAFKTRESAHYGPFTTEQEAARWARSPDGRARLRQDPHWLIVPVFPVPGAVIAPPPWTALATLRRWLTAAFTAG